jgi:hypothetical protein
MYDVDDLMNRRFKAAAMSKKIVATVDHKEQQQWKDRC